MIKKLLSFALVLSTTGCLSITGVEIAGLPQGKPDPSLIRFHCENGYKGSIKHRGQGVISMVFSDGKDKYVTYLQKAVSTQMLYKNDKNTLRWQEQGKAYVLTYPDHHYATTGKLLTTRCKKGAL